MTEMTTKKMTLISAIAGSCLIAIAGAFVQYEYSRSLPSGVSLSGIQLGGLNRSEVLPIVETEIGKYESRQYVFTGRTGEKTVLTPEKLGVEYLVQATVNQLFRDSSWVAQVIGDERWLKEGEQREYAPVFTINQIEMEQTVKNYFSLFEKPHANAYLSWNDHQWSIVPEEPGAVLKQGQMTQIVESLTKGLPEYQEQTEVSADYDVVPSELVLADVQPLFEEVVAITAEPLVLEYQRDEMTLDLASRHDWLEINEREGRVSVNTRVLDEYLQQFAIDQDRLPGQVLVTGIEEQVSEYDGKTFKKAVIEGNFERGRRSDLVQLEQDIRAIFADPEANRTITVAWEPLYSEVISQVPGYSFPQLLSTGVSSYRLGNHPNRIKNIELSLLSFDKAVIEPGEEVSFNRLTGWITPRKGYTKTKIISEGRVEEGVGGGVCQSSTTIYRAALNAGFPMVERRNHTLDVSYYHAYGYGLDATVYTDARSDLRFVNDFPGPILVHTYTDNSMYEAHVEIYGMTDERKVELTNIATGNYLLKKWEWKVVWPDREDTRYVISRYQVPKPEKEEEEENPNPLEA